MQKGFIVLLGQKRKFWLRMFLSKFQCSLSSIDQPQKSKQNENDNYCNGESNSSLLCCSHTHKPRTLCRYARCCCDTLSGVCGHDRRAVVMSGRFARPLQISKLQVVDNVEDNGRVPTWILLGHSELELGPRLGNT